MEASKKQLEKHGGVSARASLAKRAHAQCFGQQVPNRRSRALLTSLSLAVRGSVGLRCITILSNLGEAVDKSSIRVARPRKRRVE